MGRRIIRTLLCAGILLASGFTLAAQEVGKTAFVVLEVKDVSGAVVEYAQVQILPLPNKIGKNLKTDSEGKLSVNLPSGTYDMVVSSPGFRASTQRVEVKTDTHQTIAVVLNVQSCPPGPCTVVTNVFPVSFPAQSQAVSPDGRYAVLDLDSDTKPHHTVFLEDRFLRTRRTLFHYERHVVLLWNSDSQMFAVTDYIGSDSSTCSIISVDDKVPRMQALDLLLLQLGEDAKRTLQSRLTKHHAYVEASEWDGPTSLALKVSGYGDRDPKGFTEFYDLHLPVGKPELPRNRQSTSSTPN